LASTEWEEKFPLTTLSSLTRIGSDHTPLLLDTGDLKKQQARQFFFERQWCSEANFSQEIEDRWADCKRKWPEHAYSMDKWHGGISNLRSFLRGWGNNLRGEYRKKKNNLLSIIQNIDNREDDMDLYRDAMQSKIDW